MANNQPGHSIGFSLGLGGNAKLTTDSNASQTSPRDIYVYAHTDATGKIFYVGQGSGRRAWSRDRDDLWHRYVQNHLHGSCGVRILADGLSAGDAHEREQQWICQESEGLVNRQNMARGLDLAALNRRDDLMAKNRKLLDEARPLERSDAQRAIALYKQALVLVKQYSAIDFDTGLFGKMQAEHIAENGGFGQIGTLDRLTLCLMRAGLRDEASAAVEDYFSVFRRERTFACAKPILKRVGVQGELQR